VYYPTFWKSLQTVAGLEKLAASDDTVVAKEAQELLAKTCDVVFTTVKTASGVVPEVIRLRETHCRLGEKVAVAPELAAELVRQLKIAEYVDNVLDVQLTKLAGDEYAAAREVQLLGREYAVSLMRGLLA